MIAPKDGKEREGDEEVMTNGRAVKREDPENPGVFLALRLDRDAFRELHESQPYEIEGRLYKTVWLPEGKTSFSVSKVNQNLSFFFIVFWSMVTCYITYRFVGSPSLDWLSNLSAWCCQPTIWQAIIILVSVILWMRSAFLPDQPS
ncbi:MAG: hypothetical protein WA733_21410 [Methylocystis sp.]